MPCSAHAARATPARAPVRVPSAQSCDLFPVTQLYFCVTALDLLGAVEALDVEELRTWIYSLQIGRKRLPGDAEATGGDATGGETDAAAAEAALQEECAGCGFLGGPFLGRKFGTGGDGERLPFENCHTAMTYTALAVLLTIGDDLSGVDREAVVRSLRPLQTPSGSFQAIESEAMDDMRFLYCACVVSHLLGDWRGVDVERAAAFVMRCQTYEGGFGLAEGQEAHGGATYCAVASLWLMGCLGDLERTDDLVRWCLMRQGTGFNGRANKDEDTCYSFWVGCSLHMLGYGEHIAAKPLLTFLMMCVNGKYGGFSKAPGALPDVMHSLYSLCGLSLIGYEGLPPIHPATGLSLAAAERAGVAAPPDKEAVLRSSLSFHGATGGASGAGGAEEG